MESIILERNIKTLPYLTFNCMPNQQKECTKLVHIALQCLERNHTFHIVVTTALIQVI